MFFDVQATVGLSALVPHAVCDPVRDQHPASCSESSSHGIVPDFV